MNLGVMNIFIFFLMFASLILITIFLTRKIMSRKVMLVLNAGTFVLSFFSGLFINTILGYIIFAISIGLMIAYIAKRKEKIYFTVTLFILLFMLGSIICNFYNVLGDGQKKTSNETSQLNTDIETKHMKMFKKILYEVDDNLFFTDYTIGDQINNNLLDLSKVHK